MIINSPPRVDEPMAPPPKKFILARLLGRRLSAPTNIISATEASSLKRGGLQIVCASPGLFSLTAFFLRASRYFPPWAPDDFLAPVAQAKIHHRRSPPSRGPRIGLRANYGVAPRRWNRAVDRVTDHWIDANLFSLTIRGISPFVEGFDGAGP